MFIDHDLTPIPAASANGTPLTDRPITATGVVMYLAAEDSVTFGIAVTQPTEPPASTITVSGADFAQWVEQLGPNTELYITAVTGTPSFRWI